MEDICRDTIEKIENLNTYRRGDRRAPHKPLLMLIALARLMKGQREIAFDEVESTLHPLLNAYAPPVVSRHQPELPYWHLQSDGLWQVQNADELERQKGGFPRTSALRQTYGSFPTEIAEAFIANPKLVEKAIAVLLYEHFPPSVHDEILQAVGLEPVSDLFEMQSEEFGSTKGRRRDPGFREKVLRAYEYRCAFTGFRAALGGSYFGCEAAHVQWHAYDGPDAVDNGITLEPTIHKLFDAGAWTLTDGRRILVSADYTSAQQ